jgi:hypothetical protein
MNTNKTQFRRLKLPLILLLILIVMNACEKDFPVGGKFIVSQTEINLIDTLSVSLSTVILDTLNNCGTGTMLVGNYEDEIFGGFSSKSFFQIGVPETNDVQTDDHYDSLTLVLKYNQYWFGDTTQSLTISAHPLTEKIEYDYDEIIKSETAFDYDPQPIGSITFNPRPNNPVGSISIRLSDELGIDLFTKMMEGDDLLDAAKDFLEYFPGVALVADKTSEGIIIGLSGDPENIKIYLHTSREKDLTEEEIVYRIGMYDYNKQFNNITRDFSATQFNALVEQRYDLPSSKSDDLTFLQGGTGLAIKVTFPSLPEILLRDQGKIVEAKLSISPLKNSYNEFDLPDNLMLYELDKLNRVFDNQSSIASSIKLVDEQYNEQTTFSFDISSYLEYELSDSYVDPEKGLLISLPSYDLRNTFERLIIDADNKKTMLEIYYLSY